MGMWGRVRCIWVTHALWEDPSRWGWEKGQPGSRVRAVTRVNLAGGYRLVSESLKQGAAAQAQIRRWELTGLAVSVGVFLDTPSTLLPWATCMSCFFFLWCSSPRQTPGLLLLTLSVSSQEFSSPRGLSYHTNMGLPSRSIPFPVVFVFSPLTTHWHLFICLFH